LFREWPTLDFVLFAFIVSNPEFSFDITITIHKELAGNCDPRYDLPHAFVEGKELSGNIDKYAHDL
jgi:hypothetical protein